jgi:hypothetical protein
MSVDGGWPVKKLLQLPRALLRAAAIGVSTHEYPVQPAIELDANRTVGIGQRLGARAGQQAAHVAGQGLGIGRYRERPQLYGPSRRGRCRRFRRRDGRCRRGGFGLCGRWTS